MSGTFFCLWTAGGLVRSGELARLGQAAGLPGLGPAAGGGAPSRFPSRMSVAPSRVVPSRAATPSSPAESRPQPLPLSAQAMPFRMPGTGGGRGFAGPSLVRSTSGRGRRGKPHAIVSGAAPPVSRSRERRRALALHAGTAHAGQCDSVKEQCFPACLPVSRLQARNHPAENGRSFG